MKHVSKIEGQNFTWYNIEKQGKQQLNWVRDSFHYLDEDINECSPNQQRPKLVERENYLFMVLLFPYYDRLTQEIKNAEIDLLIDKDKIILFHNSTLEPIKDLEHELLNNPAFKNEVLTDGSRLIYEILNRLLHYCFPMLNHISQDVDNIGDDIFNIYEHNMAVIKEILRIKKNIVNFRKIMQAHKSIISKLIKTSEKFYSPQYLHNYFNNLVNHTKDIWDFLENYKETINALHETHESLLSHRLNEIMKTLTIFSVIVFPLTLFAALFGMNTMNSMPLIDSPFDFWLVVAIMLVATAGMLIYFRIKKWL